MRPQLASTTFQCKGEEIMRPRPLSRLFHLKPPEPLSISLVCQQCLTNIIDIAYIVTYHLSETVPMLLDEHHLRDPDPFPRILIKDLKCL
jgi:hypothetical protein